MTNVGLLDKIQFGNPSAEDVIQIRKVNYLDKLLPELMKDTFAPPKNSSRATMEELNVLTQYAERVEAKGRKEIFDASLVPAIEDLFVRNGANPEFIKTTTTSVVADILPLITKLKFKHQRPRPQQLAHYYELKFYPHFSYFSSSPAYPSGHTCIAAVLCEVLGNLYPEAWQIMRDFVKEVAESRLYLGVHYPSDNEFSYKMKEIILKNPEFKQKYNL